MHLEPGLGLAKKHEILALFECPYKLFHAPRDALRARVPTPLADQFASPPHPDIRTQIEHALQWANGDQHHILTFDHPHYPALLKEMSDAPLVLFAHGDLARLQHDAIAIVGARNATADGRENAKAFATFLSNQGLCIVSGLAYGIDAAAHAGALTDQAQAGGTIAVLGTGIDHIYPASHANLVSDILAQNGLLLSELPLGAPPLPAHFPRRNRIVAGLSRGVLVVEAALRSGSLITARLANEMGREVFAIPGSIRSPLSRGPHALIQQGAKLVETGQDILSEIGGLRSVNSCNAAKNTVRELAFTVSANTFSKPSPKPSFLASPAAQPSALPPPPTSPLWEAIGYDRVTPDALMMRVNMLPGAMQTELLLLELDGHIVTHSDGTIQRAR